MQFKPEINDGSLNLLDNRLQRNMVFKYSSDETLGDNSE